MSKDEALNKIENITQIDEQFDVVCDVLRNSPPISQDKMLMLYALYKQVHFGDYKQSETYKVNYIQVFKYNAWSQVKGMSKQKAKEEYIKIATKIIKEDF